MGGRSRDLPDGGLLPLPAPPVRRADGGRRAVGGKWNLDHENREPPPRGQRTLGLVAPWQPPEDEIDERVRADLDALDLPTIGRDGPRWFAVTADEAWRALGHFVDHRLPHFGPHEDAMLHGDWPMAHSLLSVPLNLACCTRSTSSARPRPRSGPVTCRWPSAEGFVRQVLGWREYIWHLYWHFGCCSALALVTDSGDLASPNLASVSARAHSPSMA